MIPCPIPPELLALLVCPDSRAPLHWDGEYLISTDPSCRRAYRIEDGIPILLIEESVVMDEHLWRQRMAT